MSSDDNDTVDYDYDIIIEELKSNGSINWESSPYVQAMKNSYLVTYCVVIILCVIFNFAVIVIGCKKYKNIQNIAVWIMSLAGTHLVSCISVVFQFLYVYNDFKWLYKNSSCKLSSYITYSSMFFTATMLSLWTFRSAYSNSVCIRKCRNCNIFLLAFSWTIAAVLACPSLFSREIQHLQCIDDFDFDDNSTTNDGIQRMKAAVIFRFVFGLLMPALSLLFQCCAASGHNRDEMKIICALKSAYFVCWGPQIFLTLIQISASDGINANVSQYVIPGATMLAMIHCFISPLIFLLMRSWNEINLMERDLNQDRNINARTSEDMRLHMYYENTV